MIISFLRYKLKDLAVAAANCGNYKYWTSANDLRHEFETRSLPCSLAATLAALPSISLIPSARFTNSHEGTLQGDFSQIVIVRLVKIRAIGVWPLELQQLRFEIDLRHEFETRSLPCSLAATLAALPSISLIPSARFTNSHEGTLQGDFSQIVIVRLVKIRAIGVWPLELQQLRFEIDLRAC